MARNSVDSAANQKYEHGEEHAKESCCLTDPHVPQLHPTMNEIKDDPRYELE
jgi:hypothetical protein